MLFLSQTLGLVFVQNLLFLESMHFAKIRFLFAMSPEVIEDNGQTVQTIMDKTFVCLSAQWHAWARGRGQLKIQTVFVINYLCKSCEQRCLQYVTLVHNHSHVYRAWLFVRSSCEHFCTFCAHFYAFCAQLFAPCLFHALRRVHSSTSWHFAGIPWYNENLYALSIQWTMQKLILCTW